METLQTETENFGEKAIDPVCGMTVAPGKTDLVSVHQGKKYWFCAEGCRSAFEANPEKYLKPKPLKKKGWFGRYLERLAKINEKEFGCSGPGCH